jgi:hypothetical protein
LSGREIECVRIDKTPWNGEELVGNARTQYVQTIVQAGELLSQDAVCAGMTEVHLGEHGGTQAVYRDEYDSFSGRREIRPLGCPPQGSLYLVFLEFEL